MEDKQYPIGGFWPGNYRKACLSCAHPFTGDKRAWQCESCGEKSASLPAYPDGHSDETPIELVAALKEIARNELPSQLLKSESPTAAGDGKEAKYDDLYCLAFSTLARLRARCDNDTRMLSMGSKIRGLINETMEAMRALPQPEPTPSPFQPFETDSITYRGPNRHCKACEDESAGIKNISAAKHTCRKQQNK